MKGIFENWFNKLFPTIKLNFYKCRNKRKISTQNIMKNNFLKNNWQRRKKILAEINGLMKMK